MKSGRNSTLRLLLLAHFLYAVAFYLLLTQDNPFNFSNNYHMIGILTILYLLIASALFMFFVQNRRVKKAVQNARLAGKPSQAPDQDRLAQAFSTTGFFISGLLFSALVALPLMYYLLLLDDFILQFRQLVPLSVFIVLLGYAFWGAGQELLGRPGLGSRLIYLLLFCGLILLLLNLLTGIIPVSLQPAGESVIFPL